jgi:hypothetical protein
MLYTLAYIVGLLNVTLAADADMHYIEVYSHPDPIQPESGVAITSIDIVEEMHFEMDIEVHSLRSNYKPVFRCTDGGDHTKMPYVVTHGDGQIMTRWSTADSAWSYDSPKKGIVAGNTYHLEMDMAPGSWTVTLDGVVVYDKTGLGEPLSIENVACYVFGGSIGATIGADVTVSNLFIGIPSEYQEVYSHPDPVQTVKGQVLTYIDIVEEMHFEMDIEVHSVYGSYPNIFTCADTNALKMPSISLQGSGTFAIRWGIPGTNAPGRGQIVAGESYHLELDVAPDSWTVTLDGVVIHDESGLGAPLTFENVPCYVSNPWFGAADVTVSNLFIGIPLSSAADGSGNAAAMHSGTAEEIEHGANGNDDHTDWIMMAVTIGALAVVAVVISVVLLMKKRNATKSAEAPSATTGHVPEVSLSAISSSTTGPEVQSVAAESMTVNVDPEASPTQISETINGAENV